MQVLSLIVSDIEFHALLSDMLQINGIHMSSVFGHRCMLVKASQRFLNINNEISTLRRFFLT